MAQVLVGNTPRARMSAVDGVLSEPPSEPHVAARPELDDDSPKEACGVFGVYAPGQPVAHLTYLGLYALQHRGRSRPEWR